MFEMIDSPKQLLGQPEVCYLTLGWSSNSGSVFVDARGMYCSALGGACNCLGVGVPDMARM